MEACCNLVPTEIAAGVVGGENSRLVQIVHLRSIARLDCILFWWPRTASPFDADCHFTIVGGRAC
jgi:hypothetical protein